MEKGFCLLYSSCYAYALEETSSAFGDVKVMETVISILTSPEASLNSVEQAVSCFITTSSATNLCKIQIQQLRLILQEPIYQNLNTQSKHNLAAIFRLRTHKSLKYFLQKTKTETILENQLKSYDYLPRESRRCCC